MMTAEEEDILVFAMKYVDGREVEDQRTVYIYIMDNMHRIGASTRGRIMRHMSAACALDRERIPKKALMQMKQIIAQINHLNKPK